MGPLSDSDPVSPDEYVLRRIPGWLNLVSNRDGELLVSPEAFIPRPIDTDGISLYREHFVSALDVAMADDFDPGNHYVARIEVKSITKLGVHVEPRPTDGLPGHAIIPQLCFRRGRSRAEKRKLLDIRYDLGQLASLAIVFTPSDRPA